MKIDNPLNPRTYRNSLFTFSPRMMANRNQFFPGMPAEFMDFRNRPPARTQYSFEYQ